MPRGGPHFQSLVTDTIHYERAKVTAVLSEQLEPSGIEPTQQLGQQLLEVALQSGETIELTNYLTDVHNIPRCHIYANATGCHLCDL